MLFKNKNKDEKAIKEIIDCLLYYDFKLININLKYGVMITKFPSLANTGMGELFSKLYPIFGTNDPAKDYLIIFKPDEIIFTSHMNTFKVTNFRFFTEMISYFNILQRDVSSITDEGSAIREKNLKSIYSDFFLGETKGNIFFKDDLSKYICRNLSKKNEVWLSIDNQKMDKLEIKNLRFNFSHNDDIIYNALIDNQYDILSKTPQLRVKFDQFTTVEFIDRKLDETYDEFYMMNSDNGMDYNIKYGIEKNICSNVFNDINSLFSKFNPLISNFPIDRNSESYRLYYNILSLLV